MKYKMIVTDLDDTLLNSQGKVSEKNKEYIRKAQEAGVKFVLASGRPTFAMVDLAHELELAKYGSYLLSYNGAIVTECATNRVWLEESLTAEDAHKLHDFSREHNVNIITYVGDEIISEDRCEYAQVEVELTGMPYRKVDCFKSGVEGPVVKCIMLENPEYLAQVEKKLKEGLGRDYSVAISKPFFLEIMKSGIDKGASLLKLGAKLGIDPTEIIACGDSYNDQSMLEVAGMSVAVANAKEPIKALCDYIAPTNNEDAMAHVIERFIFEKHLKF